VAPVTREGGAAIRNGCVVRSRSHRTGLGAAALAAWVGLACAEPVAPGTRVCAEILALQVPGAEPIEAWAGAHGVALDYRVPGEDAAAVHRIQCQIAEPEQGRAAAAQRAGAPVELGQAERSGGLPPEAGRLRAQSVRVDGRELSEAELVLVNSELLLAEIRRADPGSPRSWEATLRGLRGGAARIEATLSRLTREALSSLDAWWRRPP
jgi:hypothetical protein